MSEPQTIREIREHHAAGGMHADYEDELVEAWDALVARCEQTEQALREYVEQDENQLRYPGAIFDKAQAERLRRARAALDAQPAEETFVEKAARGWREADQRSGREA